MTLHTPEGARPLSPGMLATPTPNIIVVGTVRLDESGEQMVMLRVESTTGMNMFFMEPKSAQQIGKQLQQTSRSILLGTSKLIVPNDAVLPTEDDEDKDATDAATE